MFLNEFRQFALGSRQFGLQHLNGGLFIGEIAGNNQDGWNQVHFVSVLFDDEVGGLLHLFVLNDLAGFCGFYPSVCSDKVNVVLHDLIPIVHQFLIDIVWIQQGQPREPIQ